jgi:hypothetical protein
MAIGILRQPDRLPPEPCYPLVTNHKVAVLHVSILLSLTIANYS